MGIKDGPPNPRPAAPARPGKQMNYQHMEACCIMTYQCEKCKKTEEVYNGRDGVTPFVIGCRFCDGHAQHINWQYDLRNPEFTPFKGMRVFTDMTQERAWELAEKRLESFRGTGFEPPAKDTDEYKDRLRRLAESIVNDCCSVDLIETV